MRSILADLVFGVGVFLILAAALGPLAGDEFVSGCGVLAFPGVIMFIVVAGVVKSYQDGLYEFGKALDDDWSSVDSLFAVCAIVGVSALILGCSAYWVADFSALTVTVLLLAQISAFGVSFVLLSLYFIEDAIADREVSEIKKVHRYQDLCNRGGTF